MGQFQKMLQGEPKQIVILADANLYTEELEAIAMLADQLNATLICPMQTYTDESFGDDWLKSSQRAANAKAIEALEIKTEIPNENTVELLINFNHPDFTEFSAVESVSFQTHSDFQADLILPLAVFSESSGSLINEAGIVQQCQKAIYCNEPIPSVLEWITMFRGEER